MAIVSNSFLVSIVNLLYLLKEEPKTRIELYESGAFSGWKHIYKTLLTCKRAGLIVKSHREWFEYDSYLGRRRFCDWFAITSLGLNFLKVYDRKERPWRIQEYKNRSVKQVAGS